MAAADIKIAATVAGRRLQVQGARPARRVDASHLTRRGRTGVTEAALETASALRWGPSTLLPSPPGPAISSLTPYSYSHDRSHRQIPCCVSLLKLVLKTFTKSRNKIFLCFLTSSFRQSSTQATKLSYLRRSSRIFGRCTALCRSSRIFGRCTALCRSSRIFRRCTALCRSSRIFRRCTELRYPGQVVFSGGALNCARAERERAAGWKGPTGAQSRSKVCLWPQCDDRGQ